MSQFALLDIPPEGSITGHWRKGTQMPVTKRHKYHIGQQIRTNRHIVSVQGGVDLPVLSVGIVVAHHRHGSHPVYLCDFGPRGELVCNQEQIEPDLALFTTEEVGTQNV